MGTTLDHATDGADLVMTARHMVWQPTSPSTTTFRLQHCITFRCRSTANRDPVDTDAGDLVRAGTMKVSWRLYAYVSSDADAQRRELGLPPVLAPAGCRLAETRSARNPSLLT